MVFDVRVTTEDSFFVSDVGPDLPTEGETSLEERYWTWEIFALAAPWLAIPAGSEPLFFFRLSF